MGLLKSHHISLLIILSGCLLFFPFLGSVHLFDWDEINFAECAREMIVSKNYLTVSIDYRSFSEKPPLFIWMQLLSMKIFGINEFAARFPNAICGIITLLVLFHIGKKIKNIRMGLLWVLAFAGSFLPHFYFKSGIIDPWFNLLIFLGIYFFILHTYQETISETSNPVLLSALFIGLAVLTKGPVALLIFLLCVMAYWILNHFKKLVSLKQLLFFTITLISIGGSWFVFEIIYNYNFIGDFIRYQLRLLTTEDAGHSGPIFYHVLVLLFGCFPASLIAIPAFRKNDSDSSFQSHFKKWMIVLFMVVLILFSIVKTKIAHYSSLCYFPLSFLAAYSMEKIINGDWLWKKWMSWLAGTIGIVIGIILLLPPIVDQYKDKIISSGIIKDVFVLENLKASVYWSGYEILPGAIFIAGIVCLLLLVRRRANRVLTGFFVLSTITINITSILIVPKIEQYSQGAAIDFYKSLQNKSCYVETLGFKSYAHLFYSRKDPENSSVFCNRDCLLESNIDKPAFFVCKINKAKEYQEKYPQLKELYRKHGFVFLERATEPQEYISSR